MKNKIFNLSNRIIKKTSWHTNYWKGATKFWNIKDFDTEVVNLGSNSGRYAFNYKDIDVRGQNWALSPQSLVYDFNILKNYFSYLKDGATIFIPLCPFSCLVAKYSQEKNFKYYTFLHPATIIDFDEAEREKALKLKANFIAEEPMFALKSTIKEFLSSVKRKLTHKKKCDYRASANSYISGWERQFNFKFTDGYIPETHIADKAIRTTDLRNMIDFCLERGFKPVLVIPPMHYELHSRLTPQIKEDYIYSFVKEVNRPDILFLDYSSSDIFTDEDFSDTLRMSIKGSDKFTGIILKELGIIL